ncbi:MAG: AAA family ATPase [Thermodesulfovibrionales bacterium]|nr:AAA family ATPase [Thermodesulfovibrionales bacterium]
MRSIFIGSNKGYTGKTFFAIGLALKLMEEGYKVGYIKPFGKTPAKRGHEVFDADALFVKEALSLSDPMDVISPFVLNYETQNVVLEGDTKDIKKKILNAFESQRDKDFVIIGGAGDLFEGSTLGIDALRLIEEIDAGAIIIEFWSGDVFMDTIIGARRLLGKRFIGGIINKVPLNILSYVKETSMPFLQKRGVTVLGVFQKDNLLESISVNQINEILNGHVLCCDDKLDELVENFSIGAMEVDSAISYFRRIPNKAVITGACRFDIHLAAMETSTKCIILTGGLGTNDVVIGQAQSKGIPIISVTEDTFTAINKIEAGTGKTRIRGKRKTDRAKELIDIEFNMDEFLKSVNRN